MTTIIYDYDKNQIACDSRINADGVVLTDHGVKWKKHADGSVWFFTGNPADDEGLMKLSHNDKPEVEPSCRAIYAKNGFAHLVTFDGPYCAHTRLDYSHAIGSGWKFALSALGFGCNAEKACAFASEKDCYTGGRIHVFDLNANGFV